MKHGNKIISIFLFYNLSLTGQRNEPGWKLIKALTNDNKNVCFFIVINSNADCLSNFRLFSTSNCRSEIRTNIFVSMMIFRFVGVFHCSSTFIRKLKTFFHCIVVYRTLEFGYISQWCRVQMWNFQKVPRTAQSNCTPRGRRRSHLIKHFAKWRGSIFSAAELLTQRYHGTDRTVISLKPALLLFLGVALRKELHILIKKTETS